MSLIAATVGGFSWHKLAVQEWRAAMENRPPFLDDGRERHPENLSTHDMERLVSEAFCIAASLNNAADDDEYRAAMREGLHTFDMLRERYGIAPEYGLWSMVDAATDHTRTLSARYGKDGSEILVSRGDGNNPRRLTPRECARLMGYPDSFVIPVSDTQAYRQFGNSVAVPVIRAIGEAMKPYLSD